MRLNDYRRIRNPRRSDDETQLIITGHSFGGLIVYSALSHALMERAGRTQGAAGGRLRYDTATSFGDFVVLVNPAFEGSLYEPLFHIATNRCYEEGQRPVMMIVTSEADDATGIAFPLGRRLGSLFEHAKSDEQADSILKAVGHHPRYQTHWLRTATGATDAGEAGDEDACGCPHLTPTAKFEWREYFETLRQTEAAPDGIGHETAAEGRRYRQIYGPEVDLIADPKYTPNYPYLVVKTDAEVIANHNAIYNERFIKFLHLFFLQHIAERRYFPAACWRDVEACDASGPVPCERSCRLADGGSCSGRSMTDLPPPR